MGREKRVLKLIVTVFMVFMLSTSAFAKDKKSNIVFTTDKFTGITKAEIKKHATAYFPSGLANRGWIEFYAIATMDSAHSWSAVIRADAYTDTWQFLDGVDAIVLVDGQPINLHFRKGDTQVTTIGDSVTCIESLVADIDKPTLDKIANSKDFEIEFGSSYLAWNFKSEVIEWYREFDDALTAQGFSVQGSESASTVSTVVAAPDTVLVAYRKAFIDAYNTIHMSDGSHAEFQSDSLVIHTADASQKTLDDALAKPTVSQSLAKMQVKMLVYTNDKGLTFSKDF